MKTQLLILAAAILPQATHAECTYIAEGLEQKMKEYKAFKEHNLQTLTTLLATETNCKEKGATISSKLAQISAAESCAAQNDVADMHRQMTEIGGKCENTFQQIHQIQTSLRAKFEEVQTDLEDGMDYMKKSEILQEYCGKEIKDTKKMVEGFLVLEQNIVQVEARSVDGQTNYGKFKETAQQLHTLTAARGANCGAGASVAAGEVAKLITGTHAQGAPVPNGHSENAASDVTGVDKAKQNAALGAGTLAAQRAPDTKVAVRSLADKASQSGSQVTGRSPASQAANVASSLGALKYESAPAGNRAPASAAPSIGDAIWGDKGVVAEASLDQKQVLLNANEASAAVTVAGANVVAPLAADSAQAAAPAAASAEKAPAQVVALGEMGQAGGNELFAGSETDLFQVVKKKYQATELFRRAQSVHVAGY